MAKQPYTPCRLYVDGADGIAVSDFITTAAGSAYLVQTLRVSRTLPERKYMGCLRWPIAEIPADARCYQLIWYRR
ncbi:MULTISPECIES: hypothetical protein [Pseudomonas]|uniref:hypothetical protein n=1 Tax=Pseudomonas TaxID=286 RepID=UPI0006D408BD|nr:MULTISPECIES: hypothetical protein [Pseudomonas]MCF3155665.1 hypothetical protein [Pseudomonas juntendi]MCQ1993064.1 hypothetical protein [Pseudomonas sp. Eb3]UJW21883.1 hypothetical protein L2Y89_23695 [Pseudomonas juntendi]